MRRLIKLAVLLLVANVTYGQVTPVSGGGGSAFTGGSVSSEISSPGVTLTKTLGAEVLTQTCVGWGLAAPVGAWSCAGDTITRTASGSDLTITNAAAVVGTTYEVVVVTATVTAGTVTASYGGQTGTAISTATTTTAQFTATATTALTLTASATFAGTITVSTTSAKAYTSDLTASAGPVVITSPGDLRVFPASGFGIYSYSAHYFASGTAAAPSINFLGDDLKNTGLYLAAANFIGISSDGAVRAVFGSNLFRLTSDEIVAWSSGSGASTSADVGITRATSGRLRITDGTATGVGAIGIETANGGYYADESASELLTLSTSGATTDTSANLLPAGAVIDSVVVRITTTITTATDWSVGDPTTAARFCSANATLTAGTTSICLNHAKGNVTTEAAGRSQTAAAKVRITTTGTPGAGAIRITVFYRRFVAPTS